MVTQEQLREQITAQVIALLNPATSRPGDDRGDSARTPGLPPT